MLGHGIRAAGCQDLAPMLLNLGVPVVASWQAKDLVDNRHPAFLGCTGIYGNRGANKALANADQLVVLGNRLSLWNISEHGLAAKPEVLMVDVDPIEATRLGAEYLSTPLSFFIRNLESARCPEWMKQCLDWNTDWLEHRDTEAYINSYKFTNALTPFLEPDHVIVTDMGAPLMSAHQVLRLKPPQRLMTSGGLGEMGVALPAAIGACFAGAKHVLCLHADGGMMMNLQELQTILHHNLPIKIIIYENEGYLMMKHTQKAQSLIPHGVSPRTGVSLPDYERLLRGWGFRVGSLRTSTDFSTLIPQLFGAEGPAAVIYHMDPEQPLVPKMTYRYEGPTLVYDTLSDMSPHKE